MPSDRSVLEDQIERVELRPFTLERFHHRRQRKDRNRRTMSTVVALLIAVVAIGWLLRSFSPNTVPADHRSEDLGIFAPVAGRIVYSTVDTTDLGYDPGLWGIDPNGPADSTPGSAVADDVASTLVGLGLEGARPIGWSSDGTELLIQLQGDPSRPGCDICGSDYLLVLHADGSETRLNSEPMYFAEHSATISPDGAHVVFAAQGDHLGLYTVDIEGGQPEPLPYPGFGLVGSPTFSPDGSKIAYLVYGDLPVGSPHKEHVWVADADGTNAHEIFAGDPRLGTMEGLQWSPTGDRIAASGGDAIYTFAPDGTRFSRVISDGTRPYWSADGTQIAYTRTDPSGAAGLVIAEADGSHVREFGFGASGPWHPVATDEPA